MSFVHVFRFYSSAVDLLGDTLHVLKGHNERLKYIYISCILKLKMKPVKRKYNLKALHFILPYN